MEGPVIDEICTEQCEVLLLVFESTIGNVNAKRYCRLDLDDWPYAELALHPTSKKPCRVEVHGGRLWMEKPISTFLFG